MDEVTYDNNGSPFDINLDIVLSRCICYTLHTTSRFWFGVSESEGASDSGSCEWQRDLEKKEKECLKLQPRRGYHNEGIVDIGCNNDSYEVYLDSLTIVCVHDIQMSQKVNGLNLYMFL